MGAGEEVDEVAEGAGGMGVDRIGDDDRPSEMQAAGLYETGFTAGFLARLGARNEM